jgi:hypothetical protein
MCRIWKACSPIFTFVPNFRSSPERRLSAYEPNNAVRWVVIFMSESPREGRNCKSDTVETF